MIISVVNQKGGTGKTTVATNLAATFAGDKKDILLIDADPQQSALDWQRDRPENFPHVSVIGLPSSNLHREVEKLKNKYDLIIIDGGGRVTASGRAAVSCADFILVPTLASKPDSLSTQKFFKEVVEEVAAIKGNISGAILFTMLKTGTAFNIAGQEQIRNLGYPVFDTVIYHRITYQEAISKGLSVIEYSEKSKASEEIINLYKEVQEVFQNAQKEL